MEKIWGFIMMHQIETLLLVFAAIILAFIITH